MRAYWLAGRSEMPKIRDRCRGPGSAGQCLVQDPVAADHPRRNKTSATASCLAGAVPMGEELPACLTLCNHHGKPINKPAAPRS